MAYDDSLLALLPADIDGLTFEPDPDALADLDVKALGTAADRIAIAVISDVESGELAVTSVLHLRDGAFGDAFFRSYRDSYDVAACEPAGGKAGNAEAQIGGHRRSSAPAAAAATRTTSTCPTSRRSSPS